MLAHIVTRVAGTVGEMYAVPNWRELHEDLQTVQELFVCITKTENSVQAPGYSNYYLLLTSKVTKLGTKYRVVAEKFR